MPLIGSDFLVIFTDRESFFIVLIDNLEKSFKIERNMRLAGAMQKLGN